MAKESKGLLIENNVVKGIGSCRDACVFVPDGVVRIENLGKAPSVKEIYLPDSVTELNDCALLGCSNLKKLSIGKGVKAIDDVFPYHAEEVELHYRGTIADWCQMYVDLGFSTRLFVNGKRIKGDVVIPDGVQVIKDKVFYPLQEVTALILPDSIKRIGKDVMWITPDGYYVEQDQGWFELGDEEKYIGNKHNPTLALIGTITMKNQEWYDEWDGGRYRQIEVLDGCKVIADGVFWGCDNIYEVLIPDGVVTIGDYAFVGCAALERIVIPSTLEYLGKDALADCDKLKKVEFKGTKAQWLKIEGSAGVTHKVTCSDGEI